jgi:rfaE bifunctional protein kinase chain/domain
MTQTLQERLISTVRRFGDRKLLIIGDAIADRFVYGGISRVSREAPVFILRHEHTETVPGGAANCAMNLAALGANVSLIAVVGKDEAGSALCERLAAAGVDTEGIIVSDKAQTTTKMRILAGHSHSNKQQVIRIDYEGNPLNNVELRDAILDALKSSVTSVDAAVISDYNYGVVSDEAILYLKKIQDDVPVFVDSRFRLSNFFGFLAATPNQDEVEHLAGQQISSTEQLELAAQSLKRKLGYQALLVTRGGQGMMLLTDEHTVDIPAVGAREPVDVTGAGDTVIATFALAIASDASFADAAHLANYAGGLVVMKRGTATVTAAELEHSILKVTDGAA